MTDYWSIEVRRLFFIMLGGFLLGMISGYWLPATLLTLLGYVSWTLYKLRQLQIWLIRGSKAAEMPDSDGAWEQIAYLIHREHQKSKNRKKKRTELLMRFNSILEALPDAAVLLGKDNEIQWANKSAPTILGIHEHTDLGQRIDNLVRNPELHTALLDGQHDKPISFAAPHNEEITIEAKLLPVQGGLRLLHARDISQRMTLQRSRKAFIANASHELRTPLTVLSGYMELFESDPDLPEYLRPALQQSQEQAKRMQQIIQDMLELSRLENVESIPARGKPIPMPALLADITRALQDTLAGDTHTLESFIEPELFITGMEKDVISVISNLIGNAIRHTPAGTHIRICWNIHSSGHACLSIEDDGPGIPKEHLPHLTERFYRVDAGRSRENGGTGLGLAIVKHIMKWHGGFLAIQSDPGKTCFRACFPAERVCELDARKVLN